MSALTTVEHGQKKSSFFLFGMIANALKDYLPRRIKRMVFLLSISALLRHELLAHKDQLLRLNRILNLAYGNSVNALQFPFYLSKYIWKGIQKDALSITSPFYNFREITKCHLSPHDFGCLVTIIKHHAPEWIIYGSDNLIAYDLRKLFETIEEINPC